MHDEERARADLRRQGFIPCNDPPVLAILKDTFALVKSIFPSEVARVHLVLLDVFITEEQPKQSPAFECDGLSSFWRDGKSGFYSAICISASTICTGTEYLIMVFLHELAHLLIERDLPSTTEKLPHDEVFECMLNELLNEFSRKTGMRLQNDYSQYGE